jgi:hypothetical protein
MKNESDFRTYQNGRICLHCFTDIPDQEHGARIFCPRVVLPDGSIKSCKDDYWAENRKNENSIYKIMNAFHAQARAVLMKLHQLHLPEITPEILDSAGIQLNKCLLHNMNETGEIIFHFLDYAVSVHPTLNNIKIFKHETELF